MTDEQAMAHLLRHGNHATPVSRYGRDTAECAPVAVAAARIFAREQGVPLDPYILDWVMGLVVNDSDDPAHLIEAYGDDEARAALENAE